MAYNAQWIDQLDPTKPAGTEVKSLGDDAIREIKTTLSNSFPNVVDNDPYTGTFGQLNDLIGGATLPRGALMMYYPDTKLQEQDGPTGWTVCDGRPRKSGGGTAPNLVSRFILGAIPNVTAGTAFGEPSGEFGGSADISLTGNVGATNLTADQIPDLTNNIRVSVASGTQADDHASETCVSRGSPADASSIPLAAPITTSGLLANSHTHSLSTVGGGGDNLPPYFTAVYIIKD